MRRSEAFRLQVVPELRQGRFESAGAAGRAGGVKSCHTAALRVRTSGLAVFLAISYDALANSRSRSAEATRIRGCLGRGDFPVELDL